MAAQGIRQQRPENRILAEVGNRRDHVHPGSEQLRLQSFQILEDEREQSQIVVQTGIRIRRHEEDEAGAEHHEHPARHDKRRRFSSHSGSPPKQSEAVGGYPKRSSSARGSSITRSADAARRRSAS